VEDQLEKTSGEMQLLDVSIAVLTMAVTLLIYLLAMSLVDHWLVPGGLGVGMRTLALLALVVGLVFYARNKLLPYLRYKINPAFAAYTIEQAEPSLKNSVLNFLLLRRQSRHVPEVVIRGVEQQAATGLSRISVDSAVDHGRLVRLGVVVVGIILAGALYKVFSPKDLLPTVGRLMIPWADIDPVTRVHIVNLQPGNTEVPLRAHVEITADVKGLHSGEPVFLVYSSRGGGSVGQRVPMYREAGQRDYSCLMPEAEAGLNSDLDYRIEAGDCTSQTYRLTLVAAPSFQVQSVEYHYPPYTGLASRTVKGVGDLKAVDGTEVMIRAEASEEISSATVNLEGRKPKTKTMDFENREAECQLSLRRMVVGEESIPELTGYQLHLTTPSGDVNENAIRHQITIIRDQPPLVEILMPDESSVAVPADGELFFQVRARDPDFRLAELFLTVDQDENELFQADLFKHYKLDEKPLRRAHRETFRFVPQAHGLKAGDAVDVTAIAVDNKRPHPNRSGTSRVRVQITAPRHPAEKASREATAPRTTDRQQPAENEETASASGEQQGGEQEAAAAGEPGGEQDAAADRAGADGNGGNQTERSDEEGSNGGGQRGTGKGARRQSASDGQTGDGQTGDGQTGDGQTGDGQTGDGQTGDGQTGDGQNESDRQGHGDGRSGRLPAEDRSSRAGGERQSGQEESSSDPVGTESEEPSTAEKVDNDGDAFEALNERIRSEPGGSGRRMAVPTRKMGQPVELPTESGPIRMARPVEVPPKTGSRSRGRQNARQTAIAVSNRQVRRIVI
jgi:hypothetical protein